MMPILYKADETEFDTYGIGVLSDCTFAKLQRRETVRLNV